MGYDAKKIKIQSKADLCKFSEEIPHLFCRNDAKVWIRKITRPTDEEDKGGPAGGGRILGGKPGLNNFCREIANGDERRTAERWLRQLARWAA